MRRKERKEGRTGGRSSLGKVFQTLHGGIGGMIREHAQTARYLPDLDTVPFIIYIGHQEEILWGPFGGLPEGFHSGQFGGLDLGYFPCVHVSLENLHHGEYQGEDQCDPE